MLNKYVFKWSFVIFITLFAFSASSYAQKVDCSQKTELDVVIEIYAQMKIKYSDHVRHVNVTNDNGVVKLTGWAADKKAKKEIEKIAKKNKCVKNIVNNLSIGRSGDCAAGQKECGGICIGEKENCNICQAEPLLPGCGKK